MKTQLSVQVKGDFLMWYTSLPIWILSRKPYVGMYIDRGPEQGGELIKLKLRKEPYIIDIEPGEHEIWFKDSNAGNRNLISVFMKMTIGFALGMLGTDSISRGLDGAADALAVASGEKTITDNYMHIVLHEGDFYKISVKPIKKGIVKIEELH